jgi:hypothetical protein
MAVQEAFAFFGKEGQGRFPLMGSANYGSINK